MADSGQTPPTRPNSDSAHVGGESESSPVLVPLLKPHLSCSFAILDLSLLCSEEWVWEECTTRSRSSVEFICCVRVGSLS